MATKPTSTQASGAAAVTARASKPRSPRVSRPKHSKSIAAEEATVIVHEEPHQAVEEIIASLTQSPVPAEDPKEMIAKIAYGYWEERGFDGGNPLEDWVRAEEEYKKRNG